MLIKEKVSAASDCPQVDVEGQSRGVMRTHLGMVISIVRKGSIRNPLYIPTCHNQDILKLKILC